MAKSSKGSAFEREVCKSLSMWWSEGDTDDVFWRTSQSGGRATTRNKKGKRTRYQEGDITATDPIGHPFLDYFTLELKRGYQTASLFDVIDRKKQSKQVYEKWIDKIEETRKRSGARHWLLIVRRNGRVAVVIMDLVAATELKLVHKPFLSITHVRVKSGSYVCLTLKDFTDIVSPHQIINLIRKAS